MCQYAEQVQRVGIVGGRRSNGSVERRGLMQVPSLLQIERGREEITELVRQSAVGVLLLGSLVFFRIDPQPARDRADHSGKLRTVIEFSDRPLKLVVSRPTQSP